MSAFTPRRACAYPGCGATTGARYCTPHARGAAEVRHQRERERQASPDRSLYRTERWKNERVAFLKRHPTCCDCGKPAKHVDHSTPHRGDPKIFWDQTRWKARCHSCHSRKTALHDGGFGLKPRTPEMPPAPAPPPAAEAPAGPRRSVWG